MARRFIPEGQTPKQETNRAEQIQRKHKEFASTNEASTVLLDVDGTILWFMKNTIKPKVIDNGVINFLFLSFFLIKLIILLINLIFLKNT